MHLRPQNSALRKKFNQILLGTWSPLRSIVMSGALLTFGIAASGFWLAHDLYGTAIRETEHNLLSLAAVLAEGTGRSLQAIELVQEAVANDIVGPSIETETDFVSRASTLDVNTVLKNRIAALPQVNAITILDKNGKLVNFSRRWPIPDIDLSDRDYFKVLSGSPFLKRFVSRPVQNRGDGAWTVYIAHSVISKKGQFLGLVLGAVDLAYFDKLFARVAPEADDVLSMFRTDGMMIARYPARPDTIGKQFLTAGASKILAQKSGAGVTRTTSPIDGRDRIVAIEPIVHYQLVLSVSRTADAVLTAWHKQAAALALVVVLLVAGLWILVRTGTRQLRAQSRLALAEAARVAAEERARGEQLLRQDYARFGEALDSMRQGLCLFDTAHNLVVSNARFAEMYGLAESLRRPGTSLEVLIEQLGARMLASDAVEFTAEMRAAADARTTVTFACQLGDDRIVAITATPVAEGGFVCTHEDETARRRAEATIAHMAHHDALTGLPNRLLLGTGTAQLLASPELRLHGAVLLLDLDGFKQVNDAHGHPFGDALLQQVAARLRETIGPDDILARLGGDEFAIVRRGSGETTSTVIQPDDAINLARRIVNALQPAFSVESETVAISTSIGIALPGSAFDTPELILRNADIALYRAKAAGRGRWCLYEDFMECEIRARQALQHDLQKAIVEEKFILHYQPIVETQGGKIVSYEALLRWHHPIRGLVSPAEFIPLAEETGLICQIGAWVLKKACADAVKWSNQLTVAVNLSPAQFRSGELLDEVRHALTGSGLPARRLELEITESVLMSDDRASRCILKELHHLGVQIAMDDFGTGYSSLSYLGRFPFDKIKIDQSFVRNLFKGPENLAIVRAAIGLGRTLGMTVLAEGVETAEACDVLTAEGCHQLQGFLFGRPAPLTQEVATEFRLTA